MRARSGKAGEPLALAWLGFLVYASHLALDALVTRPQPNAGVPVFWPLLSDRFFTRCPLPARLSTLLDLDIRSPSSGGFWGEVLSRHGLVVFLGHALLFAPLPIVAWLIRRGVERWRGGAGARPERRRAPSAFGPAPEPAGED